MKLVIDLGFANSSFINSSVNGSLFIRAPEFEELSYPIDFSLVCNNETRCPKEEVQETNAMKFVPTYSQEIN